MYLSFRFAGIRVGETEGLVHCFLGQSQRLQFHSSVSDGEVFFGSCFVVVVPVVIDMVAKYEPQIAILVVYGCSIDTYTDIISLVFAISETINWNRSGGS